MDMGEYLKPSYSFSTKPLLNYIVLANTEATELLKLLRMLFWRIFKRRNGKVHVQAENIGMESFLTGCQLANVLLTIALRNQRICKTL